MARSPKDKGCYVSALFDIEARIATELANELDAIFCSENNLFIGAEGKTFFNCATLTPSIHVKLKSTAAEVHAACVETCMASSIPQARNGELLTHDWWERVRLRSK